MRDFRCITQVAHGGMGRVWLVQHIPTSICYVVKESAQSCEAQMLEKLHHPSIPRIFEYRRVNEKFYIVMEYINGKTFTQVIQSQGKRKEGDVIEWMLQVIEIICYLHKNHILYCDMKPENIILSKEGTIYLIDFGCAIYKECQVTPHYGTMGFAAREQYEEGQLDERADIYGVAKVMIALLSGVYMGEEVQHINLSKIDITKGLKRILKHCIEEDREKRYQSIFALKHDVERYMKRKRIKDILHHLYHTKQMRISACKYE